MKAACLKRGGKAISKNPPKFLKYRKSLNTNNEIPDTLT